MNKTDRKRIQEQAQAKRAAKTDGQPKKDKPPVLHSCGHATKRGKPEDICGPCKHDAEVREAQRLKAERGERPKRLPKVRETKARLPDGSVYHKVYEAAKQQWHVNLEIPQPDVGTAVVFSSCGSGSIGTELECDRQYREWVKKQEYAKT